MSRTLQAWINEQHVGTLHEANGVWAFEYSANWLAHPGRYPLCPGLPLREGLQRDGGTTRPAQWYFDNLLPEEGQRTLLAGSASLDAHDAFALLAYYGAESAGSVTLLPDAVSEADRAKHPLPDDELSRRIRQMPHIPLAQEAKKRMSLAGAQHKLAVILTPDDSLYEPVGGTPSTHILKPDHPDLSYAHSVINEWFVMTLAARVRLNVPTVSRRYVPQPVYLIQRFDRQHAGDQGWIRLHSIDACQLLGLDRSYKYSAGSVELLARLANLCNAPAIARGQLFNWLTFNVLTGNTDAHLKNLSGIDSHRLLRGTGVFYEDVTAGRAHLSPTQFLTLIGNASRLLDADDRSFLFGQRLLPGHYGEASHALKHACTLLQALERLQRLRALLSPLLTPRVLLDDKRAYLYWTDSSVGASQQRFLAEASMTAVVAMCRQLSVSDCPGAFFSVIKCRVMSSSTGCT